MSVFLGLFALGLKTQTLPSLGKLLSIAQPFLAAIVFALSVIDFFYLSNSFLLTVAHFLLFIQGLRLLSFTTLREVLPVIARHLRYRLAFRHNSSAPS